PPGVLRAPRRWQGPSGPRVVAAWSAGRPAATGRSTVATPALPAGHCEFRCGTRWSAQWRGARRGASNARTPAGPQAPFAFRRNIPATANRADEPAPVRCVAVRLAVLRTASGIAPDVRPV